MIIDKDDTHETITLGSAGVFISDHNSFKNLSKLLEVLTHGFTLSLPSKPANEHFGESRIPERGLKPRTRTRSRARTCRNRRHGQDPYALFLSFFLKSNWVQA